MDTLSSPQRLLEKMALSAHTLSYIGTATYEQSGVMRSVRIVHAVRDGKEFERLEYLDGPSNEIIRRGNPVDCERVSDLLIKGEAVSGATPGPSQGYAHLEDYYQYSIRGDNRVAGRRVVEVFLQPRDRYRYGHLLSLDKNTGLLLQSMLVGNKGSILERFQFTSIDIGVVIDESLLQPAMEKHFVASTAFAPCPPVKTMPQPVKNAYGGEADEADTVSWRATWVPPGFVLADFYVDSETDTQEMIYTDGMSSFSVFIDPDSTRQLNSVEARRGATVAYLVKSVDREKIYTVCVVGELPMRTARLVAEAVARAGDVIQ